MSATTSIVELPQSNGSVAHSLLKNSSMAKFSWLDPHPTFVILLIGAEEQPFGIQKDFLCSRSTFYARHFASLPSQIENIIKLPATTPDVFAFAQHFMYTNSIFPEDPATIPSYEVLVELWKLGNQLDITGLCDETLKAMVEVRQLRDEIPATPLLVKAWKETPEGSPMRVLLLEWAAEYMRSSQSRAEFARSLPQEVLSELVLAMSALDAAQGENDSDLTKRKTVHYLDDDSGEEQYIPTGLPPSKKARISDGLANGNAAKVLGRPRGRPPVALAKSTPNGTVQRRKSGALVLGSHEYPVASRVGFCADLLSRMLSGPGFWTRLVGPFREPVDPKSHGVPDYFDKIGRPMDLGTMKAKMDAKAYGTDEEFLADMNQIFTNCYTYWKKTDAMYASCEKLETTFREKYAQMGKWLAKMDGAEE